MKPMLENRNKAGVSWFSSSLLSSQRGTRFTDSSLLSNGLLSCNFIVFIVSAQTHKKKWRSEAVVALSSLFKELMAI